MGELNYENSIIRSEAFLLSDDFTIARELIAAAMFDEGYVPNCLSRSALSKINRSNIYLFVKGTQLEFVAAQLYLSNKKSIKERIHRLVTTEVPPTIVMNPVEFNNSLNSRISYLPAFIRFSLEPEEKNVNNKLILGICIKIAITPTILAKIERDMQENDIDKNEYDMMISYSRDFVERFFKEIGALISKPAYTNTNKFSKSITLFEKSYLKSLPKYISVFFSEANRCYANNKADRACTAMLRAGIEAAITKKMNELGLEIYNKDNEKPLSKKLDEIAKIKGMRRSKEDIGFIKWLADNALHNVDVVINHEDIKKEVKKISIFIDKLLSANK